MLAEVAAVRLYSGPLYAALNAALRQQRVAEWATTSAPWRAFRTRVQAQMGSRLEMESRSKQAEALRVLKAQLDYNEKMDYGVTLGGAVLID